MGDAWDAASASLQAERLTTAATANLTDVQYQYFCQNVLPLHAVNTRAEEQMDFIFNLLRKEPHAIHEHLCHDIFPETMEFQVGQIGCA